MNTPDHTGGGIDMASEEIMNQLTDLETRRAWAEMNAERLEDADNAAGAQAQREEAQKLYAEFERIARENGLDLDEDNW